MNLVLLSLLIAAPTVQPGEKPALTFHTAKDLAALEQCLTAALSRRGDVTAVNAEGYVTLMYQEGRGTPMLIDLAPPDVRVTTEISVGTGRIIRSCL